MNRITLPARSLHFAEHGLEPLFELAAELRAGDQSAHVERDDALVLEALRHVALHDPQREPFDDRRLADARLADQHRVVLRAPREHLDHAADFLVAADHRVELALAGPLDQVDAVFFQGLELAFRDWIGDASRAADLRACLEDIVVGDASELEHLLRFRVAAGQGEQQVLGRDELVLHVAACGSAAASNTFCRAGAICGCRPPEIDGRCFSSLATILLSCCESTSIFSSIGRTMPSSR